MILEDKLRGTLIGLTIGDAMGTPVRGLSPEDIESKYGKVSYFIPQKEYSDYGHISELTEITLRYADLIIEKGGKLENSDLENTLIEWGEKQKKYGNKSSVNDPLLAEYKFASTDKKQLSIFKNYCMSVGGIFTIIPVAMINTGLLQTALNEIIKYSSTLYGTNIGISGCTAIGCALSIALDPSSTFEGVIEAAIFGAEEGQKFGYHITSYDLAKRITDAVEMAKNLKQQGYELLEAFKEITKEFGNSFLINEALPATFGLLYLSHDSPLSTIKTAINAGGETGILGGLVGMLTGAISGVDKIPETIVKVVLEKNNLNVDDIVNKLVEIRNKKFMK